MGSALSGKEKPCYAGLVSYLHVNEKRVDKIKYGVMQVGPMEDAGAEEKDRKSIREWKTIGRRHGAN